MMLFSIFLPLSITKNHLPKLQSDEDYSDNSNKEVEAYGHIDIKQVLLDDFNEIAKSYLCILSNGVAILPSKFNIDEAKLRAENEEFARRQENMRRSEELLNSIEPLDRDFSQVKN